MNNQKGIILLSFPPERLPQGSLEKIKALGGPNVVVSSNAAEIEKILDTVEIAAGNLPFDLLTRAPNLSWIQLWSAGADIIQKYPVLKTLPCTLTTTSGIHGPQMAEHLFGMLLSYIRRFQIAFPAQQRREWYSPKLDEIIRLNGKKMLILGYGSIGKYVAKAAQAFGMEVTGLRRHPPTGGKDDAGVTVKASSELMNVLPAADFVVNILPFTQDTADSIGKDFFENMKRTGVYINLGRGGSTNEDDLTEALATGTIAGALLDVFRKEPLPPNSPLWDMENVIITSHYAGFTPDYDILGMEIFLKNLEAYVEGKPLINVVDKDSGY